MKKKILVSGPALSSSGYGRMCRFALRSLREYEKYIDLHLLITNWGNTGNVLEINDDINWIISIAGKTEMFLKETNNQPNFDMSIQITIPNEWKKMASVNIGYTAGIETNMISPAWLEPTQLMDKIIVISEHAKSGFINTIFSNQEGKQFKVSKPVDVCHFPVKYYESKDLNLNLKKDFNFLAVCQWGNRKNLEQTIINFIEEFKNEDVGLVLKVNTVNDSCTDKEFTEERLNNLLSNFSGKKCSVILLHGHMSDAEMNSLYNHPKIKAIVSTTHGEGFGFPLFEAAYNDLPVITTNWSGHLDFLTMKNEDGSDKKMFAKVDFELKPIAQEHVWPGVLEANTLWAYPLANSFKAKMREVYKDYSRFKSWAKKLGSWVRSEFEEEKLYNKFFKQLEIPIVKNNTEVKQLTGLSFCIPTAGFRKEKTDLLIKSIRNQKWNIPYEIIICGAVDEFKEEKDIKLINMQKEAHSRKVASLRNAAANSSKYDIVFCDDDIILSSDWLEKTQEYSKNNSWDVLGNKVLLPDGGRYWDRATLNPHQLVPYGMEKENTNLYQSSAFFLVRKEVFEKVKWDETKLVFADQTGDGIPEDVQYTLDLYKLNYLLSFNQDGLVWHNDDSYSEWNKGNIYRQNVCLKKSLITEKEGVEFFAPQLKQFKDLICSLR